MAYYTSAEMESELTPLENHMKPETPQPQWDKLKPSQSLLTYRVFHVDNLDSPERPSRFMVDDRTAARVSHNDYSGSGYDRGHMAPNYAIATRHGADGQLETFLMSNIISQKGNLNRRIWKDLELLVAKDYGQNLGEVWVTTGPIFDENFEKLESGVEIPDACYKIIVDEDGDTVRVIAFIMGQDVSGNEPLSRFLVSVDEIENATGLDFLSKLPDDIEDRLEREKAARLW
jgi:endonuclease G